MNKFIKYLFKTSYISKRWLFLLECTLFLLFAFWGWEYGAFSLYLVPAILCLVQYFYPTIFLWSFLFSILSIATIIFVISLLKEVYKWIIGVPLDILIDFTDSFGFILLAIAMIWLSYMLFRNRPIFRGGRGGAHEGH